MFKITAIPALDDNYIWAIHNDSEAVVVDPGDASPVLEFLAAKNLALAAILCTHRHHDHVGGIAKLRAVYNVPVYGRAHEKNPHITHPLAGGERLRLDAYALCFDIIDVPGHLDDHIAYYCADAGILFCGDIIFGAGCGKNFEGTGAQLYASLQRLAALPDATLIYCAHEYTASNLRFANLCDPGNPEIEKRIADTQRLREQNLPSVPFTLAQEKATNPFLRCTEANIVDTLGRRGLSDTSELSVFAALREWRNCC